jgi:hypothetical protein
MRNREFLSAWIIVLLVSAFLGIFGLLRSSFSLIQNERRIAVSEPLSFPEPRTYWALIIGIDRYQDQRYGTLTTAVNDARELKEVLLTHYGFLPEQVILRSDAEATLSQILLDMRTMAAKLGREDNWLIYFAGHGYIDTLTNEGYWIPVDGRREDTSTWLNHARVKAIVTSEKVLCRSICVIADSCFSGLLLQTRGGGTDAPSSDDPRYVERLKEFSSKRARQIVTSGGNYPIIDQYHNGHSLFAFYFLKALRENAFPAIDLENLFYTSVWKPIVDNSSSKQRPLLGRLPDSLDEEGQFVFAKQRSQEVAGGALTKIYDIEKGGYVPSGWMGDAEKGTSQLQVQPMNTENPHSPPHCQRWTYNPGSIGWAAVAWQFPENNWGDLPGKNLSARDYKFVSVYARGVPDKKGRFPVIQFKAGGHTSPGMQYQASFAEVSGEFVTLGPDWKEYTLDIAGKDLTNVPTAFVSVIRASENEYGATFYLDDINYR